MLAVIVLIFIPYRVGLLRWDWALWAYVGAVLLWLLLRTIEFCTWSMRQQTTLYRRVKFVARWSMLSLLGLVGVVVGVYLAGLVWYYPNYSLLRELEARGGEYEVSQRYPNPWWNVAIQWVYGPSPEDVEWIGAAGPGFDDDFLARLAKCKNARGLYFENTQVTDDGMKELGNLTKLDSVSFHSQLLTAQGVANLPGARTLKSVDLRKSGTTDGDLQALQGLNLQLLYLNDTAVTDAGVAHLSDLPTLAILVLSRTRVAGETLGDLENTPVQSLWMEELQLTPNGVMSLGRLQTLRFVNLRNSQLPEEYLWNWAALPQFEVLNLEQTNVSDAALQHIATFPRLSHLDLAGTNVTDAGVQHLATLSTLTKLRLDHTQVTGASLVHLNSLPSLQSVTLRGIKLTDADVPALCELVSRAYVEFDEENLSVSALEDVRAAFRSGYFLGWPTP
jgi:Leucine-rich repeat (LRR) protein